MKQKLKPGNVRFPVHFNPDMPNGTFIRRFTYLTSSELSINTTNENAAIASQGVDKLSTKVWRDK